MAFGLVVYDLSLFKVRFQKWLPSVYQGQLRHDKLVNYALMPKDEI